MKNTIKTLQLKDTSLQSLMEILLYTTWMHYTILSSLVKKFIAAILEQNLSSTKLWLESSGIAIKEKENLKNN